MGQFDETLTQHECDEIFGRIARIKIFSQVLFFSKANRQSSFIRSSRYGVSRVYGCDRWHHRLEAFETSLYFYFFLANFFHLFKHDTTCLKGFHQSGFHSASLR